MDSWVSSDFESRLCTRSNDSNPFAFDRAQDRAYTTYAIKIFKKATTKMDSNMYNEMARKGWFDPNHEIGEQHQHQISFSLSHFVTIGSPYVVNRNVLATKLT